MPFACRQPSARNAATSCARKSQQFRLCCRPRCSPRCQLKEKQSGSSAPIPPRRILLLAPALTAAGWFLQPHVSNAIGIPDVLSQSLKNQLEPYLSAPAEFLRTRQQANGGEILLAPIRASRQVLEAAEKSLQELNIYEPDPAIYTAVLSKVRRASLDCYIHQEMLTSTKDALDIANAKDDLQAADNDTLETKATQATQKWIKIADPCTFRLIAKNVTSLLPRDQKDLKVKTYKQLNELIQSFQLLDDIVDMAQEGDGTARERLPGCLQFTLAHITSFENCILTSLGLAPVLAT